MGNTASKPEYREGDWSWCFWRGITWVGPGLARETRMDCSSSKEHSRSFVLLCYLPISKTKVIILGFSALLDRAKFVAAYEATVS